MNNITIALIAELESLLNHDTHYPLNGPCEANCVEKAIKRYIKHLEVS